MLVTRHPPYRPGRAVFPHPVLRVSSLPRCTAAPAGTHAPTWTFRHTRTRARDAVEAPGTRLPGGTALLASPPVAPGARTVQGPTDHAVARAGGPVHASGVVVASASRRQTLPAGPPRQGPGWCAPC